MLRILGMCLAMSVLQHQGDFVKGGYGCKSDGSYGKGKQYGSIKVKYFNGNKYYFSSSKKSWQNAERACLRRNSDLVKIDSIKEYDWLKHVTNISMSYWIGATDLGADGHWIWSDSSPVILNDWADGEPNGKYKENCGLLNLKGLPGWWDYMCFKRMRYICEMYDRGYNC